MEENETKHLQNRWLTRSRASEAEKLRTSDCRGQFICIFKINLQNLSPQRVQLVGWYDGPEV